MLDFLLVTTICGGLLEETLLILEVTSPFETSLLGCLAFFETAILINFLIVIKSFVLVTIFMSFSLC